MKIEIANKARLQAECNRIGFCDWGPDLWHWATKPDHPNGLSHEERVEGVLKLLAQVEDNGLDGSGPMRLRSPLKVPA